MVRNANFKPISIPTRRDPIADAAAGSEVGKHLPANVVDIGAGQGNPNLDEAAQGVATPNGSASVREPVTPTPPQAPVQATQIPANPVSASVRPAQAEPAFEKHTFVFSAQLSDSLRMRSASQRGESIKSLICKALAKDGYAVHAEDLVDRRRRR
jgi:hypothetical protein